ncbi:uncharacterized protein STEHIDRAFT_169510 [Stereum hirsutum FP-91666 SS1]|uniref:uncharacterized protein n=1 Tax=Stereum hirsutum (strain FP-91666) TaxID=721885 RepID=UPI00044497C5|nr:uncharacterized protein STEHIDRAFT_169510 [Stereum hirsutum FP-91666 SS1]EIM85644.1 hypothetical protein STEHIDRAFT_169510 [Stereum hirsutum FP-91666 SS1]
MRLSTAVLASVLSLLPLANAQYFSEGWAPGMPVPTMPAAPPPSLHQSTGGASGGVPEPVSAKSTLPSLSELSERFSLQNILSSAPVSALFDKAGINITERLANAQINNFWDSRIPLITDENWEDILVNEELTEEEEKDRVWFILITVTAATPNGVSKYADEMFDQAYNLTQIAGDLPDVRWGRIDYINVTSITTKWGVWQAPMIVVAKDRAQTLRFFRATQISLKPEALREFLRIKFWEQRAPWKSSFAPGGDYEYITDYLAIGMKETYRVTNRLPRWALYLITGAIGSFMLQFFHRGETKKAEERERKKQELLAEKERLEKEKAEKEALKEKEESEKEGGKEKEKKSGNGGGSKGGKGKKGGKK